MKEKSIYPHVRLIVPITIKQEIFQTLDLLTHNTSTDILYIGRSNPFGKTVLCTDGFLSNFADPSSHRGFDWGTPSDATIALARAIAKHLALHKGEITLEAKLYQELLTVDTNSSWQILSSSLNSMLKQ